MSCLELLFPHQRSTHTSIGTTSFKDRSNLGVMATLNAQGKGQPPFNYYSLDASNNGFIEGLEGLYSCVARCEGSLTQGLLLEGEGRWRAAGQPRLQVGR